MAVKPMIDHLKPTQSTKATTNSKPKTKAAINQSKK